MATKSVYAQLSTHHRTPARSPWAELVDTSSLRRICRRLLYRCLTTKNEAEAVRYLRWLRVAIRDWPEALDLLGVSEPKRRGRRNGSIDLTIVEEGLRLALAEAWGNLKPVELLRMLNRCTDSNSPEFQWIRGRLKKGRAAMAKILEEDPGLKTFQDTILPILPRSEVLAELKDSLRPLRRSD